jgi:colicin import membrane protein
MNRVEKKCFIGSATFHGLLLVVFLFGSAFFNSPPKDMGPVLDFSMGAPTSGGGSTPPPPPRLEQVQPPKSEPVKAVEPEVVKPKEIKRDPPKEAEKEKGSLPVPIKTEKKETKKDLTKPSPLVNTKPIKRSNVVDKAAMQLAQAQREREARAAREAQALRDQVISEFNNVARGAGKGLSRSLVSTSIGNDSSGGIASGRYGDGLKALYDSKWILNADMYNDETAATVKVTVRRDGSVLSATIIKSSGNAAFDRSVRAALNGVSRALPFPADMKDSEQEFTWKFERKTRVG